MDNMENKVVRFGLNQARTLAYALVTFMRWYNNRYAQQHNNDNASKEESKEYTDLIKFYHDQYKQGNVEFIHDSITTENELNKFTQLAKQYGVSYYIEKRPPDLMDLIQKKQSQDNLSPKENEIIERWTDNKNGEFSVRDDEYQLTLAVKAAAKIESLLKDLTEWRKQNLESRLEQSRQLHQVQEKSLDLDAKEILKPEMERGV